MSQPRHTPDTGHPPYAEPTVRVPAYRSATSHSGTVSTPIPPAVIPAPTSVSPLIQEHLDDSRAVSRERMRQRRHRGRRRGGEWAWVVIAGALFSVVLIISVSVALIFRTTQTGVRVLPTAVGALPTPIDARQVYTGGELRAGQQIVLDDGRSIVLQPWNGTSRFTVLVVGLDRRPGERGLAYRTDTMMLISLDPDTNSLGILSIPRDLYVEVPGYGSLQRINSAMVLGELQQPGYGPSLTMQTVQYNLGIRVHDYVALDFNGATQIIDLLGGLEIDVPYDIVDYEYPDMNYGYDPLILRAGLQWMDGATALKFARTRHGDSDFERARRQQMVLYALRDRILNLNMLPQLIIQSPSLLNALQNSVYTGMSLDQMIQLALYLKDVSTENIRTGVIDGSYIQNYVTAEGAAVLVPRRSQLSTLLSEVFGSNYAAQ